MQKSHFWFQVEILWILGAKREPKGGQNGVKKASKNQLFLVVFLEGSKSLGLVASGPRDTRGNHTFASGSQRGPHIQRLLYNIINTRGVYTGSNTPWAGGPAIFLETIMKSGSFKMQQLGLGLVVQRFPFG